MLSYIVNLTNGYQLILLIILQLLLIETCYSRWEVCWVNHWYC